MSNGVVKSVTFNYMTLLLREDPEYWSRRRDVKLYEFSERDYRGDPRRVATAYPDQPTPSDE